MRAKKNRTPAPIVQDDGNGTPVVQEFVEGSRSRRRRRSVEETEIEPEKEVEEKEPEDAFFSEDFLDTDSDFESFGSGLDFGSNDDEMSEAAIAEENNAEMEILDVFKVNHNKHRMDVVEESEPELEPEPEPEPELEPEPAPVLRGNNVLVNLQDEVARRTESFGNRLVGISDVEFDYTSEKVPGVQVSEGALLLANYKVYIDGTKRDWDKLFEIKVPKGSFVEIETGVTFSIPEGYVLEISLADGAEEKYSVTMHKLVLTPKEALESIIVTMEAESEGAYVSKIGRVIKCQLVKSVEE